MVADVASKQQTTALFLSTIVTHMLCRRGEGQGLQLIFKDRALPILSTI